MYFIMVFEMRRIPGDFLGKGEDMSGKSKEKDEKTRKTEIHDIIKQQLFDYVKDNKITQEELARRLGVSTSTISRWHQWPNIYATCLPVA